MQSPQTHGMESFLQGESTKTFVSVNNTHTHTHTHTHTPVMFSPVSLLTSFSYRANGAAWRTPDLNLNVRLRLKAVLLTCFSLHITNPRTVSDGAFPPVGSLRTQQ